MAPTSMALANSPAIIPEDWPRVQIMEGAEHLLDGPKDGALRVPHISDFNSSN
ncbi:MAG: hypothetical protein NTZ05_16975 [Chloroflexi bacterium]|nr:hypothetical protein [Chloroflexota bacterium]